MHLLDFNCSSVLWTICNTFNRNSAYLNIFDQYAMYAMVYFMHKYTKFNELYEIIMIVIYCLNTTIYDLV